MRAKGRYKKWRSWAGHSHETVAQTSTALSFTLALIGNAREHVTAITVAIKDKMDLAIGVTVDSSMQVAFFLISLSVIIGLGIGNPNMDLALGEFQIAVMFVADSTSRLLEGLWLMYLYVITAVCTFYTFCILGSK